jgi:hypothetical protein
MMAIETGEVVSYPAMVSMADFRKNAAEPEDPKDDWVFTFTGFDATVSAVYPSRSWRYTAL